MVCVAQVGMRRAGHMEPGNSHTLGSKKLRAAGMGDRPGQYSTLSKKCKTLESSDFYWGPASLDSDYMVTEMWGRQQSYYGVH